jgi:hypothetical protein
MVNGREYYTDNGEVVVDYVPLKMEETIKIRVTSQYYQDTCTEVTVRAKEPVSEEVYSPLTHKPYVAVGAGEITDVTADTNTLAITANGPSGAEDYIFVTLPVDTSYVKITGDHVIGYYTMEGENAVYAVIKIRYASPVTVTIEYRTARWIVSTWNYVWFMLYWRYDQKFDPLYQKAVELGVDNETLESAMVTYNEAVDMLLHAWNEESLEHLRLTLWNMRGVIPRLYEVRDAYIKVKEAVDILESAMG